MKKHFRNIGLATLLPMLATAVVCADSLRSAASGSSRSLVETAAASWQADDAATGLDKTLRAHAIRLNEDNRLSGEISAIEQETGRIMGVGSIDVMLVRHSQVISRTVTDTRGRFLTQPLAPGSYTLCVSGRAGFLAYGIQVIDREVLPDEALPVPQGEDGNTTRRDSQPFSLASSGQDELSVKITAAVIPPEFSALNRIMADFVPQDAGPGSGTASNPRINVEKSVAAGGFQVTLGEDGKLAGRIAPLVSEADQPIRLREMNAFLLLDDEIYARTRIDEDGNFEFNDVQPGVYGFAAAGRDGFAALSFQAIARPTTDRNSSRSGNGIFQTVSAVQEDAPGDLLQVAISPAADIPFLRAKLRELVTPPELPVLEPLDNFAAAPGPGFGGGGGGFAGSGLDLGSIAGLALGAWVIAEVVDELDEDDFNPGPVSPFLVFPPTL